MEQLVRKRFMKKIVKAFLDRIEGDIGVLYLGDDESYKINLPVSFLPEGIKEGTNLKLTIDIDKKQDSKVKEEVDDLRKLLMENNGK